MRSLVLFLAFVAATLAGGPRVNTREGCPPEGYLPLSPMMDLSNLPSGKNYAICLTPEQATTVATGDADDQDNAQPFTLKRGLWKLSDSVLAVDARVQINVSYPARVEWSNVVVKALNFEAENEDEWSGLNIHGYYKPGLKGSASKVDQGNCGSLKNVALQGFVSLNALSFYNCSSKTSLKGVKVGGGEHSVYVRDSQLVAYDLSAYGDDEDVVFIENSNVALIRPYLVSNSEVALRATRGSSVTICDGFLWSSGTTESLYLGGFDEPGDAQNFLALAGKIGSQLPDIFGFEGQGGLYVTLKKCPSVFTSFYDRKLWTGMYTNS